MAPEQEKSPSRSENIHWHPAFFAAIQLELDQYRDILEFQSEFQLNDEPLRIDVIIKKIKDVVLEKNIAHIFKMHNLIEYKSPEDTLSIYDFYKVMGYAYNYMSDPNRKAPITSLTITLVASKHPRELIKCLKKVHKYQIEETGSGIYQVTGEIIPIQIIVSPQLTETGNLWIKGLSHGLNIRSADTIFKESRLKGNEPLIRAYLYAVLQANPQTAKEVVKMSDATQTQSLEDVLEEMGWLARWEKKGEEKKAQEVIKNLLEFGMGPEQVSAALKVPLTQVHAVQGN
ncbi:hypothetical protein FACS189483_04610 [Spirochaetia bacterium]|nr:hypothetical protein FACS189483_04610 [Spirochaetia bacterium]